MTHICVTKLTIIGSDNGWSPDLRRAIIWTNDGTLLIGTLRTNFGEVLSTIHTFSCKKMHLKCRLQNGGHSVSASMCEESRLWVNILFSINSLAAKSEPSVMVKTQFSPNMLVMFSSQMSNIHLQLLQMYVLTCFKGNLWVRFSILLISFLFARVKLHAFMWFMLSIYLFYVKWFDLVHSLVTKKALESECWNSGFGFCYSLSVTVMNSVFEMQFWHFCESARLCWEWEYKHYPFSGWIIGFGNPITNGTLLCEDPRFRHGILARGLVKGQ